MHLPPEIADLISAEQVRQGGRFVPDEDAYFAKLATHAELLAHYDKGCLQGFVFFYCNDPERRFSFITLIAVSPDARGKGLGREMVDYVLRCSKRRGFGRCRLEVASGNHGAQELYRKSGFTVIKEAEGKLLMEAPTCPAS